MRAKHARKLSVNQAVYWDGKLSQRGIVQSVSSSVVVIAWSNGARTMHFHADMRNVETIGHYTAPERMAA